MADEVIKTEDQVAATEPTAAEVPATTEAEAPAAKKRRKTKRAVPTGQVHVLATFNNTIITVTDSQGNALTRASAGEAGFRGSKKGTAYAAQVAAEKAISQARQDFGLSKVDVFVKGVGLGREAAIRTLISQQVQIDSVMDITHLAHGGVRPRKAKRN